MFSGEVQIKQEPEDTDKVRQTQPQVGSNIASSAQDREDSNSSEPETGSDEDCDYDDYKAVENFQVGRFIFCQRCSNLLTIDTDDGQKCYRLICPTCPFYLNVTRRTVLSTDKTEAEDQKEVIYDSSKANEHRQKTEVLCPECMNNEAYFYQMQTRSADEPMTNFYQCIKCKHNWRD